MRDSRVRTSLLDSLTIGRCHELATELEREEDRLLALGDMREASALAYIGNLFTLYGALLSKDPGRRSGSFAAFLTQYCYLPASVCDECADTVSGLIHTRNTADRNIALAEGARLYRELSAARMPIVFVEVSSPSTLQRAVTAGEAQRRALVAALRAGRPVKDDPYVPPGIRKIITTA
jgi:hypothetical protein